MGYKYLRDKHQECDEEYLSEFEGYKAIFIRGEPDGLGGNYYPHPDDDGIIPYKEFMDKYANKRLRLLKALKTLE